MNKLEQAAQALLAHWDTPAWKYLKPTGDLMADLREALAEQERKAKYDERFERLEKFEQAEQPVSQEYQDHLVNQSFDWAAMAAKHQFMEGYRICLAEMREKCATVSEQGTGEAVQKATLELLLNERKRIALAIRAIKFEGDTGFRPVSEMIAEHKQDPKKGAAIKRAEMRKAKQEPVAWMNKERNTITWNELYPNMTPLYATPVRTKDLTDDEIEALANDALSYIQESYELTGVFDFARAVIAADREKNKCQH